ncbi:MAG: FAD-binding protein [Gemmatimonadetes bacterium]|nr:FAD-binding protein [Gemmatimonadota bacterium]
MTLADTLRAIVGDTHVLVRPAELIVYESDGLPGYHRRPSLAVFPADADEALRVVRALAAEGVPFVPRGAGTGLSGGALADGTVLLGLQRMRKILEIDPVRRVARVEPGVVNVSLTKAAAPFSLHYAPDPSSQTACTLGGNLAENAGGPHCLKYGVTLNHVVGAVVALPDGEVVTLGDPHGTGDVAGYDLLGAFVGSEGCFGVALELTVKLTPNPERVVTLLADFTSINDAAETVSAIIAAGVLPAALEMMDQATIGAVESSIYAAGYPTDAAAILLVEVDGAAAGLDDDVQAALLAQIAEIGGRHRVRVCNVFHAGDGNLHPNIAYDAGDADESARVHLAMKEIMQACIDAGGTITGEHGVGLDKLAYMDSLFTPDTLDAMCRIRDVFDPDRRANPGKVVPVRFCREQRPHKSAG